jgi:tRNA-specific 2-thiouridylase
MHKKDIKQMAIDMGYPELAKKSESYEICFVPDNDYRGFLKRRVEGLEERVNGGWFVDTKGKRLGKHKGYPFYTIGQRKGLEIALGKPAYVTAIDPVKNIVVIGDENDLDQNDMLVAKLNWIKYDHLDGPMDLMAKIRYKDSGALCTLSPTDMGVQARFYENVKSIAPGQSAVFYEGDDVVAGGIIQSGMLSHSLQ